MYVWHTSHPVLDNAIFVRKGINNGSVDPVISNHIFDCKKSPLNTKEDKNQTNII